ncbi:hypothetical protein [Lyngbya sp. PCC 8106]|uniref:hypothetical protein n=1 Tax=Lyngbya sp. (strain PCC 8106) TaxID=313612 RepID=UPI0000EA9949|nr:hypothetical protein [Lyngbya sp. PCC 8106]EAW35163.1 hypothetical protein L8106_13650 [Lyngbya sp. PCC 8106]
MDISNTEAQKLAEKSTWATGVLTFFLLPIGYIYTGRYRALLKGFGITIGVLVLCFIADPSLEDDEDFTDGIGGLYVIAATVENTRAVHKAKQLKGKPVGKTKNNPAQDVQVQLIKLARKEGEMTIADCVLETGLNPQEVRVILDGLLREDVIRIDNRERDGAVVYRLV